MIICFCWMKSDHFFRSVPSWMMNLVIMSLILFIALTIKQLSNGPWWLFKTDSVWIHERTTYEVEKSDYQAKSQGIFALFRRCLPLAASKSSTSGSPGCCRGEPPRGAAQVADRALFQGASQQPLQLLTLQTQVWRVENSWSHWMSLVQWLICW